MLVVGPVSSLFDFLTFYVLLQVFQAGEALFHTGWFIESLATQVLVIFVIRTRGNPLRQPPQSAGWSPPRWRWWRWPSLLPFTPLGAQLGFVAPPPFFFADPGGDGAVPTCWRWRR